MFIVGALEAFPSAFALPLRPSVPRDWLFDAIVSKKEEEMKVTVLDAEINYILTIFYHLPHICTLESISIVHNTHLVLTYIAVNPYLIK